MKIHFYANTGKARAADIAQELAVKAAALSFEVVEDGSAADLIVALGGDGTILRAVHEFHPRPVLGFNLGGLGYLSSVEEKDFAAALEMLAKGKYKVAARTMLAVKKRGASVPVGLAVNDVVIMREMTGHAAVLDLAVGGTHAARYMADGLVIATPTGSTAYSLAAGGPVLMPDSGSFVVTPMNPHALGIRPMVVRDDASFVVTSRARQNGHAEKLGVYADGESVFMLEADEAAEISRAGVTAALVELDGYEPYEVMARKLGWRGSSAAE